MIPNRFALLFLLLFALNCKAEREVLIKEQPVPIKKSTWKPKPIPLKKANKILFNAFAYKWIEQAECGNLGPPCCVANPKDPGGFTCVGLSIRYNQDLIAQIIDDSYNKFERTTLPSIKGEVVHRYIYTAIPALELTKKRYYEKYFKPLDECPFNIALQIMDSRVLSGQGIRLFQRSQGLKADNIWGPNTKAACNNNPDMKAFKQERLKRFKQLKTCEHHCRGWEMRLNQLDKFINNNKGDINVYQKRIK